MRNLLFIGGKLVDSVSDAGACLGAVESCP
jgi:hypothetical protein